MSKPSDGQFGFEGLDVYQRSLELLTLSSRVSTELPPGHHALADQLRRASLSIPVNIAEGAGRTGNRDGMRHYGIARGSAMECAAIFDACRVLKLADPDLLDQARALLLRIVSMLTKMCR
jgi:four helix bundle protein